MGIGSNNSGIDQTPLTPASHPTEKDQERPSSGKHNNRTVKSETLNSENRQKSRKSKIPVPNKESIKNRNIEKSDNNSSSKEKNAVEETHQKPSKKRSKIPRPGTTKGSPRPKTALPQLQHKSSVPSQKEPSIHASAIKTQEETLPESSPAQIEVKEIEQTLLKKLNAITKKQSNKLDHKEIDNPYTMTKEAIEKIATSSGLEESLTISKQLKDNLKKADQKGKGSYHQELSKLVDSEKMRIGYLRQVHGLKEATKNTPMADSKNLRALEKATIDLINSSLKSVVMKTLNSSRTKFLNTVNSLKMTADEKELLNSHRKIAKSVDDYQGKHRCAINIQRAFSQELLKTYNANDQLNTHQKENQIIQVLDLLVNGKIGEEDTEEGQKVYAPIITTRKRNPTPGRKTKNKKPTPYEQLHQDDAVIREVKHGNLALMPPVRHKKAFEAFGLQVNGSPLNGQITIEGCDNTKISQVFKKLSNLIDDREDPPRHSHFTHAIKAFKKNAQNDESPAISDIDESNSDDEKIPEDIQQEIEADAANEMGSIIPVLPKLEAKKENPEIIAESDINIPAEIAIQASSEKQDMSETADIEANDETETIDSSEEDIQFVDAIPDEVIEGQEKNYPPLPLQYGNTPAALLRQHSINTDNEASLVDMYARKLEGRDAMLFRKYAAYLGESVMHQSNSPNDRIPTISSINQILELNSTLNVDILKGIQTVLEIQNDTSSQPEVFFKTLKENGKINSGFFKSRTQDKDQHAVNRNILPIAFETVKKIIEEDIENMEYLVTYNKIDHEYMEKLNLKHPYSKDFSENFREASNLLQEDNPETSSKAREHYHKMAQAIRSGRQTSTVTQLANRVANTIMGQARHDQKVLEKDPKELADLKNDAKELQKDFKDGNVTAKYLLDKNIDPLSPIYSHDDIIEYQNLSNEYKKSTNEKEQGIIKEKMQAITLKPFKNIALFLAYEEIRKLTNPVAQVIEGDLPGHGPSSRKSKELSEMQVLLTVASLQTVNIARSHL